MAMFPGAHDFVISGGQLSMHTNGPSGIDILLEASVPDAAVDAGARKYAPSCFPGTREQHIDDITDWATAGDDDPVLPIYWMSGPAGVGKSAIAQTCAENVKDAGHLGAAFFFSVSGRSDPKRFFTSLAYQLSTVLPSYRQTLDSAVQNDKTLVTKAISSQFNGLVVEPLRVLAKQGKEVQRRAIFIDGLDECSSTDAQSEIIEIIAGSVRDKTTPFRWAIFSRAEPHIVSTFARNNISPHTRSVSLPISRDCDGEIRMYLRAGFENMLRRRNLPLEPSWPTNEVIEKLVDASAGLFAYPAAILRFIDHHSYSGFEERLEAVVNAILRPNEHQPHSPFAELDAFCVLIMKRIPEDLLPSALLLLGGVVGVGDFGGAWCAGLVCNMLGIAATEFRIVLNALQAVLIFRASPGTPEINQTIDFARSYFDHPGLFQLGFIKDWLDNVHGIVNFHHKSFYDFLIDPTRSSTFCVTTPAIRETLFHRLIERHLHYARSFVFQGTRPVSAPGLSNSSVSLSWPQGSEFVDSYLKLQVFRHVSWHLSHDIDYLAQYLKDMPQSLLQKLAELDYRQFLVSDIVMDGFGLFGKVWVIGYQVGTARAIAGTVYQCVMSENFSTLDLVAFLKTVRSLEQLEIIKPYHRHLPSPFASAYQSLSRPLKPFGKRCRVYKLGHGEKSVIWYWEFDTEKQYFHEFQTLDFSKAKAIYDTEKFKMWEKGWVVPDQM